ncbi:MAG: helix-turn-helix domain-containing protein [Deltaproteobacteria bacterium]|nr:helix-turn-helix domain-containing protein [Deltaproteobacteria bacterium]
MVDEEHFVSAPLITVAKAAKFLGIGRKVVYQLIERGQIRAVKVGRAVRIELACLQHFKNSGELT